MSPTSLRSRASVTARGIAAVTAATLVLAACGGGGDDAEPTDDFLVDQDSWLALLRELCQACEWLNGQRRAHDDAEVTLFGQIAIFEEGRR